MLFVMDVGNTNIVSGVYDEDGLRAQWRVGTTNHRTSDELRVLFTMLFHQESLDTSGIRGACVSSVVPELSDAVTRMCEVLFQRPPVMVGPGVKTGLILQVDNPREVGADRIVDAVGALEEHEGPLIVIDFGTATTLDAVTRNAEYKGGVIIPGIQLAADALAERCAKLPRVELAVPRTVIGKDTVAHLRSGLTYGYADMVDGLVSRMAGEMRAKPKVVATGGLATVIAGIARSIDVVDPHLTLKGLRAVYRRNERGAVCGG